MDMWDEYITMTQNISALSKFSKWYSAQSLCIVILSPNRECQLPLHHHPCGTPHCHVSTWGSAQQELIGQEMRWRASTWGSAQQEHRGQEMRWRAAVETVAAGWLAHNGGSMYSPTNGLHR